MTTVERHNLQIRMEKALHTKLKEVAEIERRSISAQIHVMLNDALDEYQRKQQA